MISKMKDFPVELHEKVERLYREKQSRSGEVRAFAKKYGICPNLISYYAGKHGWIKMLYKKEARRWTNREVVYLQRNAHKAPATISNSMRQLGMPRSVTAIFQKIKELRLRGNLNGQSAASLALCMGVTTNMVIGYIRDGRLKAERRDADAPGAEGKIFYIKDKDIREFLIECVSLIDFAKIDKWWLVDILTGRGETTS